MFRLELRTDFAPEEDIDFIEKLSSSATPEIHYDLQEKIERYPHLRDRFRYEAKKRGEYTPARSLSLGSNSAYQMTMPYPQQINHPTGQMMPHMMPGMMPHMMPGQYSPYQYPQHMIYQNIDPEKQMLTQTNVNPDDVFNSPDGKKKRYFIMNTRDNAVFVSIGNKEENSIKIENFSHINSIPDQFFDYHGFRECFYGPNPALIFITEEDYRKRKDIVLMREERERQRREEIVDRIGQRGGHAGGRDENAYGDPYASYSSMTQSAQGEVVNGVYLYGSTPMPGRHMSHGYGNQSISETMDIGGNNTLGLSEVLAMAKGGSVSVGEDGLMSTSELNSILGQIE